MEWMIAAGVGLALVVVAIVGQRHGWIDLRGSGARGGGSGAGLAGIGDEVFSPTRYEAQLELDRQTLLPIPAPTPADDATERGDVYAGWVVIRVGG